MNLKYLATNKPSKILINVHRNLLIPGLLWCFQPKCFEVRFVPFTFLELSTEKGWGEGALPQAVWGKEPPLRGGLPGRTACAPGLFSPAIFFFFPESS